VILRNAKFNIQQFYVVITLILRVLYRSQKKQQIVYLTQHWMGSYNRDG